VIVINDVTGSTEVSTFDINDAGVQVGSYVDADGVEHGYIQR
jgi:hypothetical protein